MNLRITLVVLIIAIEGSQSQTHSGELTFYREWRGNPGSCNLAQSKSNPNYVAALSRAMMAGSANPNNHPNCAANKCIKVLSGGKSIVLKISDTCASCKPNDIDIADAIFSHFAPLSKGRIPVQWQFVDCNSQPPGTKG